MIPAHSSDPPRPRPPMHESVRQELRLHEQVREYVHKKIFVQAKSVRQGEDWRAPVVSALLARVRRALLASGWAMLENVPHERLDALLDQHFSDAVVACAQKDDAILWLITQQLIQLVVVSGLDSSEKLEWNKTGSLAQEHYQERFGFVQVKLRGGQHVLEKWSAESPSEKGPFWPYLRKCVDNAHKDYFDSKRSKLARVFKSFLPTGPQEQDEHFVEPSTPFSHQQAGPKPSREARHKGRLEQLERIRTFAAQGATEQPPDPDCARAHGYLCWRLAALDEERTQSAYAKEQGIAPGTLNSSMKRFVEKYREAVGDSENASAFFTTQGG